MKLFIGLCLLLIGSASADEMPFYFFYFEPNGISNPISKKEAQKKLCKLVAKNCELSDEAKFTFTILPLYEQADLKSKETGYFVNVTLPKRNDFGAFYESALASFVINKKGDRKDLTHYVSYSPDWVKITSGGSIMQLAFDEGDMHKSFFAYIRASKAVPNTPESYVVRAEDGFRSRSDFNERWYGLANPDESGGVLWLRYKSDLRSPKFSVMKINEKLYPNFLDEILNQYSGLELNNDGLQLCRSIDDKLTVVYPITKPNAFGAVKSMFKRYKGADLRAFAKDKPNICISDDKEVSRYEVEIPLEKIYKNGFLVGGVGFFGIEWKEFVEYQEAYPIVSSFSLKKEKKKK